MLRIYFASKIENAHIAEALCRHHKNFIIHARWLKHQRVGTPDSREHAPDFWLQDEQDVKDSDVVLVYANASQKLRGALVEAGMALAWGIPVIACGTHPDYSTWQYHPLVTRIAYLENVPKFLDTLTPRYKKLVRPTGV